MIWFERLCDGQLSVESIIWQVLMALPHIPDSKPTEKQLASLLKATKRTAVGDDDSIGSRTFMAARRPHAESSGDALR
jgi:hypothetical protein